VSPLCGLTVYIKKYLKAKEELWKFKHFQHAKKKILFKKKNPLKETKNPSRYHNFITNLKVSTQAKISSFKRPPMKIGLLLPRGQNPLSY
jgi:hypothetical protein